MSKWDPDNGDADYDVKFRGNTASDKIEPPKSVIDSEIVPELTAQKWDARFGGGRCST